MGLFDSPFYIVLICICVFGALTLLKKSWRAEKVGKICIWAIFFIIYFVIVDQIILPNSGFPADSANYSGLQICLFLVPLFLYAWKGLK